MASLAETLAYLKSKDKKTQPVTYRQWVANNPERSGFPMRYFPKLSPREVGDDSYLPDPDDDRWKD